MRASAFVILFLTLISSCENKCNRTECLNGGECYDGECICAKWFSGGSCQLPFNRNFEGQYRVSDNRSNLSEVVYIHADKEIPNRLSYVDGGFFEFESDSKLSVPLQFWMSGEDSVLVQGYGYYSVSSFELTLKEQPISGQLQRPAGYELKVYGVR